MATWKQLFRSEQISATGPTTNDEWEPVHQFRSLNLIARSVTAAGGTNPRLSAYIEFTDNPVATSGVASQVGRFDFFDVADSVLISDIPIHGKYARLQRVLNGTSPVYVLDASILLFE